MVYLIDTHVLIWYLDGNFKLPDKIRNDLNNPANDVIISIASIWELAIKLSVKKIDINITLSEIENDVLRRKFTLLQISFEHLNTLLKLDKHHGDPFDRLLIAQAMSEDLTIISADRQFENYPVKLLW